MKIWLFWVFPIILIISLYQLFTNSGDINVYIKNPLYNDSSSSTNLLIENNLEQKLQNITWDLLISPMDLYLYLQYLTWTNKVDIQVYDITLDKIKDRLKQMSKNWVNVRIFTEKKKYKEYGYSYEKLKQDFEKFWVKVNNDEKIWVNFMHSKYVLMDKYFIIQTSNLTHTAYSKNREFYFVSENRQLKESLEYIYESDRNWTKIEQSKIHPNLLVCNINCRSKIEYLITSAKESIYIQNQNLQDEKINSLLEQKKNLDLKIVLANSDDNNAMKLVFGKQIVKTMKKPYVHAKMLLIDKKYLIIWSINFTSNSLDNNREMAILVTDKKVIDKFLHFFENDFNSN